MKQKYDNKKWILFIIQLICFCSCFTGCNTTQDAKNNMSVGSVSTDNDINLGITKILLSPGEDETSINGCWYSFKTEETLIQFTKGNIKSSETFPNNPQTVKGVQTLAGDYHNIQYYSNKVTLNNLEPGKEYSYRYLISKDNYSSIYSFQVPKYKDEFNFWIMGDTQIGSGPESEEIDVKNWANTLFLVKQKLKNPAFLLSMGDQTDTNTESEFYGYLSPDILRSIPVAVTCGNHEYASPELDWHSFIPNATKNAKTTSGTDYYYSYNNALFIVLNTNDIYLTTYDKKRSSKQHADTIKEAIASHRDAKWKFVIFHHDIYGYPGDFDQTVESTLRSSISPLMDKYKIDAVFNGHGHNFTRSYQIRNNEIVGDVKNESKDNCQLKNPTGTVYFEFSTSASKNYENDMTGTIKHIANHYETSPDKSFSIAFVSDKEFKLETYATKGYQDTNPPVLYDTFSIEKGE